MYVRKSFLPFCLFASLLFWFVPRFVGQVNAQQSQPFIALINSVTQEKDVYEVDYTIDPAVWEANTIDHINVTVYSLLNTTVETWSRTEIGRDEPIVIPADTFPNSPQLYETYRLEMALIKDEQIVLNDSGQPILLIYPFVHRASPPPTPNNTTALSSDSEINAETNATELPDAEIPDAEIPDAQVDVRVDETADCNTLCQFQTRLDEQPALLYLFLGALGLLLMSLIFGTVQAIQNRRERQEQPRRRRPPVHSNTVIYTEDEMVSYEPAPYMQPSITQFEHDSLDDIYDDTLEYEPEPIAPSHIQSAFAQLEVTGARDVTLIGCRYDVRSFPFTIGREEADLVIDDGRISRNHARLTFDGTTFHVTDLGSSNGVYVEGQKITPNTLMPLSTNQAVKLSLGSQNHFVFWGYV